MPPEQLEDIRRQVMQALEFWAKKGLGREINNLQISIITYRKPGLQVYSRASCDPRPERVDRDAKMMMLTRD